MQQLFEKVRQADLNGLNVTIPHKQVVIHYLDELTPTAQVIGAVNTIFLSQGALVGDNTDAPGFLADLSDFFTWTNEPGEPPTTLVLGAGGAARAVVYALMTSGWKVIVAARKPQQAAELVDYLVSNYLAAKNSYLLTRQPLAIDMSELPILLKREEWIQLVVNATPVGMYPQVESSPWPEGLSLPPASLVYDLVYNPPETLWMSRARQAGHTVRNGWGMLVAQALLAFEKWMGVAVSRQLVMQSLSLVER